MADGVLSKNEELFLKELKDDLEQIKKALYSDETKQENPDLTIEQINQIFNLFFNKYSLSNITSTNLSN